MPIGTPMSHTVNSRRSRLTSAVLIGTLACCGIAGAARAAAQTFAEVVRQNFQKWDANNDGKLAPDEIDRLSADAAWKGDDAAAIATIKLVMRSKKDSINSLSLDDVEDVSKRPLTDDPDAAPAVEEAAARKPQTLQSHFAYASKAIKSAKRQLFLDPTPDLDKVHQGRIGDCFFVSVVGAMVERDAESVKRMIRPVEGASGGASDGNGYTVSFGNGQSVTVPPLTDAEYALTSSAGDEGAWLPVLEKAYGTVRAQRMPESRRPRSATDTIARGGNSATSIQYLTGHKAETTYLITSVHLIAQARPEALKALVRKKLLAASEAHRLMAAGTGDTPGVPGITPHHAYAVLGFDAKTDTLHLWNPHGNAFKPKGEAGKAAGYPTKSGRFDISLNDFVTTFRDVSIETDRAADDKR
jgi:hypothetical protein